MTHNNTFDMILDIVYETMPRDNLLNSACLELFEFIRRENIKPLILHIAEKYRDRLLGISYVDTFSNLILRYEQMQGYGAETDSALFSQEESTISQRSLPNGQPWQGLREMDAAEEAYFNASDDEEEVSVNIIPGSILYSVTNLPPATVASRTILHGGYTSIKWRYFSRGQTTC